MPMIRWVIPRLFSIRAQVGLIVWSEFSVASSFSLLSNPADRVQSYLTHYSYFGSFRSSVSNVGPNAAMLDGKGRLTNIGSWYLGNVPVGTSASAASSISVSTGWTLLVGLVCLLVAR